MIHFRTFREKDWKEFTAIVEEAFERENVQKENFIGLLEDEGFIGAFEKDKLVGYLRLLIMEGYGHLGQITHVMKLGQTCQRRSNRRLGGTPHVR